MTTIHSARATGWRIVALALLLLVQDAGAERRFTELGGFPMHGNPDEFAAFVRSEITKWAEVIRREGLTADAG